MWNDLPTNMVGLLSHNAVSCSVGSIEIVLRRVALLLPRRHSSHSLARRHSLPLFLCMCTLLVVAFVAMEWVLGASAV